ncbi:hypothetical protein E3N88_42005 [Mikania micrantha]|uniref:DUF659 domain-containing protein n=1 Tax=Mikania micrantha TaxID=192012 RepID=A0A5N6LJ39_9ASTR|nr:hypothetical protein E3N88_42005 [Mikania micrantha]
MYELSVPLLKKEIKDVDNLFEEHKKERASKGCSILYDGWRDSVVQKDILNFMVNSPKGSMFMKSLDVSDMSKDAVLLSRVLDAMVEEENVVQIDDEIEEDIGVLGGEGDGPMLGDNDTIDLDFY